MSDIIQAWREHLAPRRVELSNGLTVMVRPVTIEALVVRGTVPLALIEEAQGARKRQRARGAAGLDEDTLKMLPSINAVVMAAAVEPRIAETEDLDAGVISVNDLSLADRMKIFEEANRAATAARPFRAQPNGNAGDARDGEDVREAAE